MAWFQCGVGFYRWNQRLWGFFSTCRHMFRQVASTSRILHFIFGAVLINPQSRWFHRYKLFYVTYVIIRGSSRFIFVKDTRQALTTSFVSQMCRNGVNRIWLILFPKKERQRRMSQASESARQSSLDFTKSSSHYLKEPAEATARSPKKVSISLTLSN